MFKYWFDGDLCDCGFDIVGIENVFLDFFVCIEDVIIDQFGFSKGIMKFVDCEEQVVIFEVVGDLLLEVQSGGFCVNVLCNVVCLGLCVSYLFVVGFDVYGEVFIGDFGDYFV